MTDQRERIGPHVIHEVASIFPLLEGEDFDELVEDIREHGLREPIVRVWEEVKGIRDPLILDGRNRLRACEVARVRPEFRNYEGDDPIAYVLSLNLSRRHMNESQRAMVGARVKPLFESEAAKRRAATQNNDRGAAARAQQPSPEKNAAGRARDKAGAKLSVSGRSVQYAETVLRQAAPEVVKAVESGRLAVSAAAQLSRLCPEKQLTVLDRSKGRPGRVSALVRQHERAVLAAKLNASTAAASSTGPFRVIVADPPWDVIPRGGRASDPPMTVEQICMLPVEDLAHNDAVLWLWLTNHFTREAHDVISAWGFTYKMCATWVKPQLGMGHYLRSRTEHVYLAVRGKPTITLTSQDNIIEGPVREHSRKPDSFYELVEAVCPGSKVEMFGCEARKGWARWNAEGENGVPR